MIDVNQLQYTKLHNIDLKHYNTLHLSAMAKNLFLPHNFEGLKQIYGDFPDVKKIILGKGSNILFKKKEYEDEIFISLKILDRIEDDAKRIYCDAGISLSDFVWFSARKSIIGFEFLEDIPGTVGGAILMNAGTYTDTISQELDEVIYYDILSKEIITKKVSQENFGRRTSFFDDNQKVILGAYFQRAAGDYIEILDRITAIKKDRYLKQPRNYPNAGSVFKRLEIIEDSGLQIWKMIDDLGLKGARVNDAMISIKHTGFMVNLGNATYDDFISLIELVISKVKERYDIALKLEWKEV